VDRTPSSGSPPPGASSSVRPRMTPTRFWWWSVFWSAGWTLWISGPRHLRFLGWIMALAIAPWFLPRGESSGKVTRGQIVLLVVVLLILAAAIALPFWVHVNWSMESLSARIACMGAVVLGLGINAWRTFGRAGRLGVEPVGDVR
jgi:hypothetical protein